MSDRDLRDACRAGDMQTVETILTRGEVDVNTGDPYGQTPLMFAMLNNQASIVTRLLSIPHIRLDCTKDYGRTALHWACANNNASVIAIFGQDSRCSPAILNMSDRGGETAVMVAVDKGHLDCVKEMDKLPGTDFTTKNNAGESLIDVARKNNHHTVLEYLLPRNNQVAKEVANNTLERMNLRDIAEMEAVMLSDKQLMQTRHVAENAQMQRRHEEETGRLSEKQRKEVEELDRMMRENGERRSDLERRMQARMRTPANATPNVPECPVCLEEMNPPTEIFNCRNGHLICGECRPNVANNMCTTCRVVEYTGRATAVEQMIRQMFGQQ